MWVRERMGLEVDSRGGKIQSNRNKGRLWKRVEAAGIITAY